MKNNNFDTISSLLEKEIKTQYKNLHNFAASINMSYQTVYSIFKRGIGKASFKSISLICNKLGIDIDSLLMDLKIVKIEETEKYKNELLTNKLSMLNEKQKQMLMDYLDLLISAKETETE